MNYQTMTFEQAKDAISQDFSEIAYRALIQICRELHDTYPDRTAEEITDDIVNDGDIDAGCDGYGVEWNEVLIDAAYNLGFERGQRAATNAT